jgi:hypothetical protein
MFRPDGAILRYVGFYTISFFFLLLSPHWPAITLALLVLKLNIILTPDLTYKHLVFNILDNLIKIVI